mgnify:CR=1 FL=1
MYQNKIVLITGASRGVGLEITKHFIENGAIVIGLSKGISNYIHKNYNHFTVDLGNSEAIINCFKKEIGKKYKRIDIVINNAGVALGKSKLIDLTYEEFEWLMGINFWGVVYGTKEFLPYLIAKKEAAIVNISSLFGLAGIAEQVPYCASKFAVRGLSESLRMELMDTNVKVHSVHPGGIKTNIANNARVTSNANQEEAKSMLEKFNETALIHTPEKAAQVIMNGIKNKQEKIMIGFETYIADSLIRALPEKYTTVLGKLIKQQMG